MPYMTWDEKLSVGISYTTTGQKVYPMTRPVQ